MAVLRGCPPLCLPSPLSKSILGPVLPPGGALLLAFNADPRFSLILAIRLSPVRWVLWGGWWVNQRFRLERAAREPLSADLEAQRGDLLLSQSLSVAAAKRVEEIVGVECRSSLRSLRAKVASSALETAVSTRQFLALLKQVGMVKDLGASTKLLIDECRQ